MMEVENTVVYVKKKSIFEYGHLRIMKERQQNLQNGTECKPWTEGEGGGQFDWIDENMKDNVNQKMLKIGINGENM